MDLPDFHLAFRQVATDTVTVAGLTVAKQGFGAVTAETGGFGDGVSKAYFRFVRRTSDVCSRKPNAGLIGLGFPAKYVSASVMARSVI